MLTYKRLYMDDEVVRYAFYPEGKSEDEGIIEFYKDGSAKIIKESPADEVHRFYGIHMFQIDLTSESGTLAWY